MMMTVKKLIESLQHFDSDLPVGCLCDNGVLSTDKVGVYEGLFLNGDGPKMIYKREQRKFVIIGNPGNFQEPANHDVCKPIDVKDIYENCT